MNLDVGNGYIIRTDSYNIILEGNVKRKSRKTGKMENGTEIIGYYGNLGKLCRSVINKNLKCKEDVNNILQLNNAMEEELEETIRPIVDSTFLYIKELEDKVKKYEKELGI